MNDYEVNPGILLAAAATVISVFASSAALYLWSENRAKGKRDI